jgi:isopenicillin N synthase-like dioxygenase
VSTIPVIHLRSATEPARDIVAAFRTIGFAYLEGHGVSQELQARLEQCSADFFALSLAEKMKFDMRTSGLAWRGFFPLGGELTSGRPDQKEGFYFGVEHSANHPAVRQRLPTFGANPWPNEEIETVVTEYMCEMKRVSGHVMELVAEGLGLPKDFFRKAFGTEPTEFFRIFGYPKHEFAAGRDEWGVREHTDMGFLTVLKQDRSGGLQARMVSGDWTEVPPRDDAFVLNIGDMLEFWTGGILRSTPHRVRNQGASERFSYPYFFDPNWHASLRPIAPELLAHFAKPRLKEKRWDNLELHALSPNSTYGEFVWQKISGVFPQLAGAKSSGFG